MHKSELSEVNSRDFKSIIVSSNNINRLIGVAILLIELAEYADFDEVTRELTA